MVRYDRLEGVAICLISRWWRWILDKDAVLAGICNEVEVPGSESTTLTGGHSVVMNSSSGRFGGDRWLCATVPS